MADRITVGGISVAMHDGLELDSDKVADEVEAAKARAEEEGVELGSVHFYPCEDGYEVEYRKMPAKFERIRRITGYLVGTLDRFNDGKRAEERDRVKHGV